MSKPSSLLSNGSHWGAELELLARPWPSRFCLQSGSYLQRRMRGSSTQRAAYFHLGAHIETSKGILDHLVLGLPPQARCLSIRHKSFTSISPVAVSVPSPAFVSEAAQASVERLFAWGLLWYRIFCFVAAPFHILWAIQLFFVQGVPKCVAAFTRSETRGNASDDGATRTSTFFTHAE